MRGDKPRYKVSDIIYDGGANSYAMVLRVDRDSERYEVTYIKHSSTFSYAPVEKISWYVAHTYYAKVA